MDGSVKSRPTHLVFSSSQIALSTARNNQLTDEQSSITPAMIVRRRATTTKQLAPSVAESNIMFFPLPRFSRTSMPLLSFLRITSPKRSRAYQLSQHECIHDAVLWPKPSAVAATETIGHSRICSTELQSYRPIGSHRCHRLLGTRARRIPPNWPVWSQEVLHKNCFAKRRAQNHLIRECHIQREQFLKFEHFPKGNH
jgi:hypothetical protein